MGEMARCQKCAYFLCSKCRAAPSHALFYPDKSAKPGTLLMHIDVGPSAWQRRDGIRFFDELRILVEIAQQIRAKEMEEAFESVDSKGTQCDPPQNEDQKRSSE